MDGSNGPMKSVLSILWPKPPRYRKGIKHGSRDPSVVANNCMNNAWHNYFVIMMEHIDKVLDEDPNNVFVRVGSMGFALARLKPKYIGNMEDKTTSLLVILEDYLAALMLMHGLST